MSSTAETETGHPARSADELLALCVDTEREARAAELRRLECALGWAHLHLADEHAIATGQVEVAGGEGTPEIDEFAAEPLGAVFATSTWSARQLMADALDLHHRLPLTWARVRALEVPAWRARRIAQATSQLSAEAAAAVDAALAPRADKCGTRTIERVVAETAAQAEPEAQAEEEVLDRRHWGVKLFHGPLTGPGRWAGTSMLEVIGDTVELTQLFELLTARAETDVAATHPDESVDVRRSIALGQLMRRTDAGRPVRIKLVVHADLDDLSDETIGTGSVERLGPLTTARIKEWCASSAVTVLPVLRTGRADAVDQHDPPAWMRELVILRDRHCVHPWCETDARACDLDHVEEYVAPDDGGPPGQTRPDNLAPLCRRHHRIKTARLWDYVREPDGSYAWTGPHGLRFRVDPEGTTPLS